MQIDEIPSPGLAFGVVAVFLTITSACGQSALETEGPPDVQEDESIWKHGDADADVDIQPYSPPLPGLSEHETPPAPVGDPAHQRDGGLTTDSPVDPAYRPRPVVRDPTPVMDEEEEEEWFDCEAPDPVGSEEDSHRRQQEWLQTIERPDPLFATSSPQPQLRHLGPGLGVEQPASMVGPSEADDEAAEDPWHVCSRQPRIAQLLSGFELEEEGGLDELLRETLWDCDEFGRCRTRHYGGPEQRCDALYQALDRQ